VAALFLLFLAAIFVGMGATVLKVVQGDPPGAAASRPGPGDSLLTAGPPLLLMAAVLGLGLFLPRGLEEAFRAAAALVVGG
jgi:hydrogenase-4 component F